MKVLFVCTGNTCRSPMAEHLTRALRPEWEVRSAGVRALEGDPASEEAQAVMAEQGLDLNNHRSQMLAAEMVEWAELIVAMTQAHQERIAHRFPEAQAKLRTLKLEGDVEDPYGGSLEDYRRCALELQKELERLAELQSR